MYKFIKSLFLYIIFNIIGINNTIQIYVNIKYYYLFIKEQLIYPIYNKIKNINKKENKKIQELIDIKLIKYTPLENKRNEYSIIKHVPFKNIEISLLDLHYAIINNKIITNYNNCNIEIIYKINDYKFIYIFPIYISSSIELSNNNPKLIDNSISNNECINFKNEHIGDLNKISDILNNNYTIFPIHTEDELLNLRNDIDYVYANFTLSKKNNLNTLKDIKKSMDNELKSDFLMLKNNSKKYDCSDVLKMYSGPNCDFYSNKYIITLTDDYKIIKIPYKLSIDMINLSYSKSLQIEKSELINDKLDNLDELIIIEIEALRDDNQDFIANLEKKNIII